MAVKATSQVDIVDLTDGFAVMLSSEAVSLIGGTTYANAATVTTTIYAFCGTEQVACSVNVDNITFSGAHGSGITVTKDTSTTQPTLTFTVAANKVTGNCEATIPVSITDFGVTLEKKFSFTVSQKGVAGDGAYNYELLVSPAAVVRAEGGTLSTSTITLSATRAQGTGTPAAYAGRLKVEKSSDGSTWSDVYTSSANESSKEVTISNIGSSVTLLRCSLYLAGGTTTLLDTQTVPVVTDGGTGGAGADAYTVVLSNESHTFAALADGSAVASSTDINIIAYKGATQMAVTIGNITGAISGKLTATKSGSGTTGAKVTVAVTTSLDADDNRQGTLTIPCTVDGKVFNKQFSWSLAPTGLTGAKGEPGEDGIVLEVTSSNGFIFKNTSAVTTLTAHVYKGGKELTDTEISALGTIKWYKDGATTAVGTGKTLSITAGTVTNRATYVLQLEE